MSRCCCASMLSTVPVTLVPMGSSLWKNDGVPPAITCASVGSGVAVGW